MLNTQQASVVWLLAHALATEGSTPELCALAKDVLLPIEANCQPCTSDDDHGDVLATWAAHPEFAQMVDAGLANAGEQPLPLFATLLAGLGIED